jgi:hypothetical protein
MVRSLLIVAALATPAAADIIDEPARPVRTWFGNDEVFAAFDTTGGQWEAFGAGLAVHRELVGHLELGVEGHALRVDERHDDDTRHGFALRGALTAAYGVRVSKLATIDWRMGPEIGVGSSLTYGIGVRYVDEQFVGLRMSFRRGFSMDKGARGVGGHLAFRVSRSDGQLGGSVLLGYDWGS